MSSRSSSNGARFEKKNARKRKTKKKTNDSNRNSNRKSSIAELDSRQRRNPDLEVKGRIIPQVVDQEDRFFVIEKLLDKRITNEGKEQYLVRWKNYGPEWNSWEPLEELERNALEMVREFNRRADPQLTSLILYCICKKPYRFEDGMVECFHCKDWFHFGCININMEEANSLLVYYCQACQDYNPELKCCSKEDQRRL